MFSDSATESKLNIKYTENTDMQFGKTKLREDI